MISETLASEFVSPLLGLPFPVAHPQLVRRMVLMFAERCADRSHAHRALEILLERCDRCPTPMQVSEALERSFEPPEPVIAARSVGGEFVPAWRCLLCKDTGLYSRDITNRQGDTYAVCGPCECARGLDRAAAYRAREESRHAEKHGKSTSS